MRPRLVVDERDAGSARSKSPTGHCKRMCRKGVDVSCNTNARNFGGSLQEKGVVDLTKRGERLHLSEDASTLIGHYITQMFSNRPIVLSNSGLPD